MSEYTTPIFVEEWITSTTGLSLDMIYAIVGLSVLCMVSLMVFKFTGSIFLVSLSIVIGSTVLGVLGYLPLWLSAIMGVISMMYIVVSLYSNVADDGSKLQSSINVDSWIAYGDKLKSAYASKFGGENLGFNDEVDKRIVVMQNNGQGFTRTIARDWLKRMQKFTEAK